jgi:hypothetical protein
MVVLFNAFCLPPITQVARKDVGDMTPRQQIRDRLTYQDEKTERTRSLFGPNETKLSHR